MLNWLRELLGQPAPIVINIDKDAIALARAGDLVIVRTPKSMQTARRSECAESLSRWVSENAPLLKFFMVEGGVEVTVLTSAKAGESQ